MSDVTNSVETRLFIPICKIDEEQRLVYGKMTGEEEDSSGEIWDYDGSKPYFEVWSSNAEKTSGGKSLGNLRSMHQPIAAGKLTQFVMDDATKEVHIAAKVVDDGEWTKVLEGVYTGFSQGGRYVKRWKDPDDSTKTRYISDPVEVSLVDLPCLPTATFEYVKADGSSEIRKFTTRETTGVEPTNEQVATRAIEMAKAAGEGAKWADYVGKAREALVAEAAPTVEKTVETDTPAPEAPAPADAPEGSTDVQTDAPTDEPAADEPEDTEKARKAARDSLVQVWQTPDGKTFSKAADAVDALVGAAPPASPVQAALKAALGAGEEPTSEPVILVTDGLALGKAALDVLVAKGLYTAGRALEVLDQVVGLQSCSAWEAEYEADGSPVPAMLAEAVRALGAAALAMAQEEVAEAIAGMKDPSAEVDVVYVECAAEADFVKSLVPAVLEKRAAQTPAEPDPEPEDVEKRAESDPVVKGLVEENAALKGQVSEAIDGITKLGDVVKTLREELTAIKNTPTPLPPSGVVVDKSSETGGVSGGTSVDVTKAEGMIAELMKTEQGQRTLAEAAIRASQTATLQGR